MKEIQEATKKEPTEEQKKAIETIDGPQMIIAGPGSGKTFVITQKIIHLINSGVAPDSLLAVTFTEKAAEEMRNRVAQEIDNSEDITICTMHSFCKEVLEDNIFDIGLNSLSKVISGTTQKVWLLENIHSFKFKNFKISAYPTRLVGKLIEGISRFREELITPKELEEYLEKTKPKNKEEQDYLDQLSDLLMVYKGYEEFKRKNDYIDFDDMILKTLDLFKKEKILEKYQDQYKYILIDEFQDTNYSQLTLFQMLGQKNRNITVVGDSDQSIYKFRGAYATNLEEFEKTFPELKKFFIYKNFRSTKQIVKLSSQLISPNKDHEIELESDKNGEKIEVIKTNTDKEEAEFVAQKILKMNIPYNEIYILVRKKKDSEKFAEALEEKQIPFEQVSNISFTEEPVVKDSLAYLRITANPLHSGTAWAKVLLREQFPEDEIRKIMIEANKKRWKDRENDSDKIFQALKEYEHPQAKNLTERIHSLIEFSSKHSSSETLLEMMLNKTDIYKRQLQNGNTRNIKILNRLYAIAQELDVISKDLNTFIKHLEMGGELQTELEETAEENSVKIMTIHQSKGKEAKAVFLCDMSERHLPLNPSTKSLQVPEELCSGFTPEKDEKKAHYEEERRVAYVAMTRAEDKLFIVYPQQYENNKNPVKPSRFLNTLETKNSELVSFCEPKIESKTVILKPKSETEKQKNKLKSEIQNLVNTENYELAIEKIKKLKDFKPENKKRLFKKDEITFSPSQLDSYEQCPRMYKYSNILKIPQPPAEHLYFGSSIHKIFEILVNMKQEGKEINEEIALEILKKYWQPWHYKNEVQEQRDFEKAKAEVKNFLEFEKQQKGKTLTEEKFNLSINGSEVFGKIDRIDEMNGEIRVIDYKTGKTTKTKNKLAEDIQMLLYAIAVEKQFGKLPKKLAHFYPNPEAKTNYTEVALNQDMIKEGRSRIEGIMENVLDEKFPKTDNHCPFFCPYKELCDE